jgi:hypothetical protein
MGRRKSTIPVRERFESLIYYSLDGCWYWQNKLSTRLLKKDTTMEDYQKFNKTVSILVQAYLNDELKHENCEFCAVGNIVHAAGAPRYNTGNLQPDSCGSWKGVFFTDGTNQIIYSDEGDRFYQYGLAVIKPTGYEWHELAKIEFAFEMASRGNSNDEWMFNGLMSVIDILAEIHNIDLSTKETAKALFVKS